MLMLLGGVGALVGLFVPILGKLIIFLCLPLLWFFETVVTEFPKVGAFQLSTIPWQFIAAYYCILIAFVLMLYRLRGSKSQ
jgi:hypothetical protein